MDIVNYARPSAPSARTVAPRIPAAPGRVNWVDAAKGICIILVVAMHATLGVEAAMGGEGFMHAAVAFAKPFRLPDFFLVSGLFLGRVIDRDWSSYADKRVVHFAYFYILWLAIVSVVKVAEVSGGTAAGFGQHLLRSLVEPFSTLWFVYLLAVFSVVTKLLRRVPAPVVLAAAVALQLLPLSTGSTLIDEFSANWVYFLAGYLFAPAIFRLAGAAAARPAVSLLALAAWAGVNGWLALTPTGLDARHTYAQLPGIALLLGAAGALAIVAAAALLTRFGLAAPLRYCGARSIAIYLAFFLPMAATRVVLVKTGIVGDVGAVSAFVTAAAVLVPLVMERLVRDSRFAFLFRRPAWAHLPRSRGASLAGLQPAE